MQDPVTNHHPPRHSAAPTYLALSVVFGVLCLPALGYAGWAFYDAAVTYPDRLDRYEQFETIRRDHPDRWRARWHEHAKTNGWPATPPAEVTPGDIATQYILGVACGLTSAVFGITALVFLLLLSKLGRTVRAAPRPKNRPTPPA